MCGIVGFQGDFDRELLDRMSSAVAHRGPDGSGAVIIRGAETMTTGLGHRRLAIIDLSEGGAQPMCTPVTQAGVPGSAGVTIVFNGEIYNYRELRAELIAKGVTFRSHSDTEVLLHLYCQEGAEMMARLNGIYAFAISDCRTSGRPEGMPFGGMLIARDQMGVKPLYYAESPHGLLFGSEIKALLEDRRLSREIDHVALHNSLAYLWSPAPRTLLAAVRKLEPGCALIVSGGKIVRHWRYYDLPYAGNRSTSAPEALSAELATRLRTAVERQLVADVPVGAFLSGGLDSSAIVAMMRQILPGERIQCFTIGFAGMDSVEANPNDLPYARRVARHLDVDLHEIEVQPEAIMRLPELVALLDEPQADPAPINALLIAEQARAMDIPVLLSGAGGDDLFGGYRRHWALSVEHRWSWLPQPVRNSLQGIAGSVMTGSAYRQSVPAVRRLSKLFAHAGADADHRLVSYFTWSTDALRRSLYTPAFAESVAGVDTAAPLLASLSRIPHEREPLQRMLYLEARHFLADHNLNYTDRAGMAVGVEVRVPLLDMELVEFATTVPSSLKQQGTVGKAIFKKAMEPYLPKDVIYRPKSGFGVPLRRWLHRELRPMVDDTLSDASLQRRGYFDPAAVRRLRALDESGRVDASYTIFALVCLELWFRRFID
ncbi:MAG TPA: asparagine synthase (glutamine-hydrolyzing) [Gemmatimonadaceae bacterium]|nr:asparagine synthase (glutamine-hydrolyzing) [Gemmatimonadaceae bacterium]